MHYCLCFPLCVTHIHTQPLLLVLKLHRSFLLPSLPHCPFGYLQLIPLITGSSAQPHPCQDLSLTSSMAATCPLAVTFFSCCILLETIFCSGQYRFSFLNLSFIIKLLFYLFATFAVTECCSIDAIGIFFVFFFQEHLWNCRMIQHGSTYCPVQ